LNVEIELDEVEVLTFDDSDALTAKWLPVFVKDRTLPRQTAVEGIDVVGSGFSCTCRKNIRSTLTITAWKTKPTGSCTMKSALNLSRTPPPIFRTVVVDKFRADFIVHEPVGFVFHAVMVSVDRMFFRQVQENPHSNDVNSLDRLFVEVAFDPLRKPGSHFAVRASESSKVNTSTSSSSISRSTR